MFSEFKLSILLDTYYIFPCGFNIYEGLDGGVCVGGGGLKFGKQ